MNIGRRIRTLALAALLGGGAASSASAGMTQYGPYWIEDMQVSDALLDGQGTIWAIGITNYAMGKSGRDVFKREMGVWRKIPRPPILPAKNTWLPFQLGLAPNHNLYCLWVNDFYDGFAVSQVSEELHTRIVIAPKKIGDAYPHDQLFFESTGALWVMGVNEMAFRLPATDNAAFAGFQIYRRPQPLIPFFDEVEDQGIDCLDWWYRLIEDGRQRVWFYPLFLDKRRQHNEQAVVKDGDIVPEIWFNNVPNMPFSFLGKKDAHTLWVGVLSNGLYEVDIETLSGKAVPVPNQRPFVAVHSAVQRGDSWYFVVETERRDDCYPMTQLKQLWQYRRGEWRCVVKGFDDCVSHQMMQDRPFSEAPNGLWMGCLPNKLLYIADAVDVDARIKCYYSPCGKIRRMFHAEGLLWLSGESGLVAVDERALLTNRTAWVEGESVIARHPIILDNRRHLWAFKYDCPGISEWDGEYWRTHPLPEQARLFSVDPIEAKAALGVDSLQRVWISSWWVYPLQDRTTFIFDPSLETWLVYTNFPQAIQAQSHITALKTSTWSPIAIDFGPDGKICFRESDCSYVTYYFDGRQWHALPLWGGVRRCFFDEDGALYAMGDALYTYSNGWQQVTNTATTAAIRKQAEDKRREMRQDDVNAQYSWQVENRQVYKVDKTGFRAPQFDPQELHPFIGGRSLSLDTYVYPNAKSNILLRNDSTIFLLRQPPQKAPTTKLRVERSETNSVQLHFASSKQQGPVWYKWRADGGAWSAPLETNAVSLRDLARGKHVIEAVAINRRLACDPTPARKTVWIGVAGQSGFIGGMKERWRQWRTPDPAQCKPQKLIRLLSARDYAWREQAAAELVRRGPDLLPLVNAGYAQADANQRWWLAAVRQRLEEQAARMAAAGTNQPAHAP